MALASSGQLALSTIRTELGGSLGQISLASAATGGIATINTNSASSPNSSAPHQISEWYSYDHSASGGGDDGDSRDGKG